MLSDTIIDFLFNLQFPIQLPADVKVMNPFIDEETRRVATQFYQKYYHDNNSRYCIIGINPGRFGGGVTGVQFTDPNRLKSECNIESNWPLRQELSSLFVYDMINAFGGVEKFYAQFYITAVSPLGFTKHGKNLNYYDDKQLTESIKPFAIDCFKKQLEWGLNTTEAFCLGEGDNFKYLSKLNAEHHLFDKIVPLPHPRFIMQYKLKSKDKYVNKYLEEFCKFTLLPKERDRLMNLFINQGWLSGYNPLQPPSTFLLLFRGWGFTFAFMNPLLIYCYDTYCGWCFGFSPVINKIAKEYKDKLDTDVLSGGMILSEKPAHIREIAPYIQKAYKTVEGTTGIKFGQDFLWHIFNYEDSDWYPNSEKPAIAMCIFKEFYPDRAVEFAANLQYALNYEGRDLTDDEAYRHLLEKYSIRPEIFYERLQSDEYKQKAYYEFLLVKQLKVNGYPTVFIQTGELKFHMVARGFTDYKTLKQRIEKCIEGS